MKLTPQKQEGLGYRLLGYGEIS